MSVSAAASASVAALRESAVSAGLRPTSAATARGRDVASRWIEDGVRPASLVRKALVENNNSFMTPNAIYRSLKRYTDLVGTKRHLKQVLAPMRRDNQFVIRKVTEPEKGTLRFAYRLKHSRHVKDLLARDEARFAESTTEWPVDLRT